MTEKTPEELRAQRAQLISSTGMTEAVLRERAEAFQLYPEHMDVWRTLEGIDYLLNGADEDEEERAAADTYAEALTRPPGDEAAAAIRARIESGTAPRRKARTEQGAVSVENGQNGDALADTPTPGCSCGHDGMGAAWHERGVCRWLVGEAGR